jgi:S1-C subfamily serine protease
MLAGRLVHRLIGVGRAAASATRTGGHWAIVRHRSAGACVGAAFAASGVAACLWKEERRGGASAAEGGERELLTGWTAKCEAAQTRDLRNQFRYFISDAVDKAAASVVKISCVRDDNWHVYESSGSGFVFEQDGSILTNAHVVQGARQVTITLRDGTQLPGAVENLDSLSDVAIVRAQAGKKQLPVATLGRSTDLRVGEWIVAMGSPGGNLMDTVTVGIVSALLRPSAELGMSSRRMTYIQTDAAINQGNSGGPIINIDGQV